MSSHQKQTSISNWVRLRLIPNEELLDSAKNTTIWDVLYPWPGIYNDEPLEYNTEAYLEERYNIIKDRVESGEWSLSQTTDKAPPQSKDGLYWMISGHTPLMIAVHMANDKYSLQLVELFLQHGAGGENLKIRADNSSGDTVLHKIVNSGRVNEILELIMNSGEIHGLDNDLFKLQNHIPETAYDSAKYFQRIYGISEANLEAIRPS